MRVGCVMPCLRVVTVKIMSIKDDLLARLFPWPRRLSIPWAYEQGAEAGIHSQQDAVLRATYLYYSALYYILKKLFPKSIIGGTASRFNNRPTVPPEAVPHAIQLLMTPVFHTSMLMVAAMLVQAICSQGARGLGTSLDEFLLISRKAGLQHNMMAVWNACRWFDNIFAAEMYHADCHAERPQLPPLPGRYVLGRLMRLCEEREVMAEGSTFYPIYEQLGGILEGVNGNFNVSDVKLVMWFVQAYTNRAVTIADFMAEKLVELVKQRQQTVDGMDAGGTAGFGKALASLDDFPKMASDLVETIVASNFHLFFNQHMFVLLACSLYCMAKAARIKLSFAEITGLFAELLPDVSAQMFEAQVELHPALAGISSADSAQKSCGIGVPAVMGGIRPFYNSIFLPCVEGHVRQLIAHVSGRSSAGPTPSPPSQQDALKSFKGAVDFMEPAPADLNGGSTGNLTPKEASTAAPNKASDSLFQSARLPASEEAVARVAGSISGARDRSIIPQLHDARKLHIYKDDGEDDPAPEDSGINKSRGIPRDAAMGNEKLSAWRSGTSMVLQERKNLINGALTTTGAFLRPMMDGLKHTGEAHKPQLRAQVTSGAPAGKKRQSPTSKENIVDQAHLAAGPILVGANNATVVAHGRTRRSGTQRIY
ncbi:hypothetical protein VaNZ11_013414 [Volvox africanus]|uniref:Uncharacterized protein n=1 Tax=Volvox africanus TaxID=51714 RepID=A0ABQ5SG10_9CHLO|nr:hypothetical protein VaNZ11_013414 [Volvox africanus]